MAKEFRIPFHQIDTPEKATRGVEQAFRERDMDCHRHEIASMEDDHGTRERVVKLRGPVTFIDLGRRR